MLNLIKEFNDNYATAISAATPFVIGFISWLYYKIYTESKLKEGDAASIVSPIFFGLRKKYKILAVHLYEQSDDISGYKHISQNSRPDQWNRLILIERKCIFFFEVKPVNPENIITVVISRNGKEKWKTISFNKL